MTRWPFLAVVVAAALGLSGCAAPLRQVPVAATYANPVLDADFPDPALIEAPDGLYYAYATQGDRAGHTNNIQLARSADLVHWDYLGDALPAKPRWAGKTQNFWAPHVIRAGGTYFMYYSAQPDASLTDPKRGLCLAVATARAPAGPFVDIGHPLLCGDSFVDIDPMAFDDPATGKHWLYWGSGFQPLKVQQLGPDRRSFAAGSTPTDLVRPNPVKAPDAFPQLVEGSWVVRNGGYYYIFYSGDNCCGPKANYAVMVARSKRATGPFQTLEQAGGAVHSIILAKTGDWIAPGHNAVITDRAGTDWIVYHAVDPRNPRSKPGDDLNSRRIMLIDRIVWRAGWPTVAGPSTGAQAAPVTVR